MKNGITRGSCIEFLETRYLLVNYGIDRGFGTAGSVSAKATLLVDQVAGGDILAVSESGISRVSDDGTIDPSFGTSGVVSYPDSIASVNHAIIVGDHLLVGGNDQNDLRLDVVEYNLDGTLATDFGRSGLGSTVVPVANPDIPPRDINLLDMSATADGGALVLFSYANSVEFKESFSVLKIGADGIFDTSFAGNGALDVDASTFGSPSVLGLSSGKFVVAAQVDEISPVVMRYNADGTLDKSFGDAGAAAIDSDTAFAFTIDRTTPGEYLVEQADHKILIAGTQETSGDVDSESDIPDIARLNADGSQDTSFGNDGVALPEDPADNSVPALGISLDSNQKIIFFDQEGNIYRLNSSGELDSTFDNDGIAQVSGSGSAFNFGLQTISVDDSDRILIGDEGGFIRVAPRVPLILASKTIFIDGTNDDDTIKVRLVGSNIQAVLNGQVTTFAAENVTGVDITTEPGNNVVNVSADLDSTILGDAGADTITTAAGNDSISAGGGDDSISSGAGNDAVDAGEGNNFVDCGTSDVDSDSTSTFADFVGAGDGNNIIRSGSEKAEIDVGSGDNTIMALGKSRFFLGDGDNHLNISSGGNQVSAGDGNNQITITGSVGNYLTTGAGTNIIVTGDGNDAIYCAGIDLITSNGGNDFIFHDPFNDNHMLTADAGAGDDTILGGDAPASVMGGDGNDFIRTGFFNDTIAGGGGKDLIHSGPGSDLISGGGGRDHIFGQEGKDHISGGGGNDIIDGGLSDDRISGQGGNDVLIGEGGNDTLDGGAGLDSMDGGARADLFNNADGEVDTIDGGTGIDTAQSDNSIDQLMNVEMVV